MIIVWSRLSLPGVSMEIKELTIEEMGALVAAIHNLSKDRLRQLVLEIWQLAEAHEAAAADKRRLVRELDVLLNGDGAAKQASLCDIVAQVRHGNARLVPVDLIKQARTEISLHAQLNGGGALTQQVLTDLAVIIGEPPAPGGGHV